MRIVQFRRSRLFHILVGSTLLLLVLYILLNFSSDNHISNIKVYLAQGLGKKQVKSILINTLFILHIYVLKIRCCVW